MKGENEGKKKKSVADDKSLCLFVTNIDLYKKKNISRLFQCLFKKI